MSFDGGLESVGSLTVSVIHAGVCQKAAFIELRTAGGSA